MIKELVRDAQTSLNNSIRSLQFKLQLEAAIVGFQEQAHIIAEGRKVVRDWKGDPIELVMTGHPNEEILQQMPPGSGKQRLPVVVRLGDEIKTMEGKRAKIGWIKPQRSLDKYSDISAVRFHDDRKKVVRYYATGIPKSELPHK